MPVKLPHSVRERLGEEKKNAYHHQNLGVPVGRVRPTHRDGRREREGPLVRQVAVGTDLSQFR